MITLKTEQIWLEKPEFWQKIALIINNVIWLAVIG